MLLLCVYIATLLTLPVSANVEKTIFLAPSTLVLPTLDPNLDDLGLERLSPEDGFLRTKLNASFPTADNCGTESWYFLENLHPGQRYEVRICWLATQPTDFTLKTFTLPEVLEDRALLSSISLYSSSRLSSSQPQTALTPNRRVSSVATTDSAPASDSVLFLRIVAAADYFSLDRALMENVPPVLADIILDPFLGNVFPKSLVPTACWVSVVACLAVFVARWIARELERVMGSVDIGGSGNEMKDR
ncbi:uncharacterized protein BJX67DRAFT_34056 [Aspergillus lucknowensis]|uniref:Uncharacterized protein n=1 Tax=Aspergillus lucknowensis TaxID=176173 RepID=A0ABR4LWC2_9EURO